MFLAIRVRGTTKTNRKIKDTLNSLNLTKNNCCMIFPENEVYSGMLNSVKDYIAYGITNKVYIKELFEKRAFIRRKKLIESIESLDYKNIDSLINDLFRGSVTLRELKKKGLKIPFRLS